MAEKKSIVARVGRKCVIAVGLIIVSMVCAVITALRGLDFQPWLTFTQWICISYFGFNVGERAVTEVGQSIVKNNGNGQ